MNHQGNKLNFKIKFGMILVGFFVVFAWVGPFFSSFDPIVQNDLVDGILKPPGADHWMGTDALSRDVLSRCMTGAQISIGIGILGALISVGLGSFIGALAGYFGGWLDRVVAAATEILLTLPGYVLIIVVAGLWLGEINFSLLLLLLGFTSWGFTCRLVRSEVKSLKQREFVQAGMVLGYSHHRRLWHHIFPQCWGVISVAGTTSVAGMILTEGAVSFMGLGIPEPYPTWGNMIASGMPDLVSAPWTVLFPGICICLLVLGVNFFGEGLREWLSDKGKDYRAIPKSSFKMSTNS